MNTQKEKCGYEGEIGTDLDSSQMILKFLQEKQWLGHDTDVLFFEQTFYNGNLNSFLMLRISFEKTHVGILAGQLDIKQMVYKNPKESTPLFVCNIVIYLIYNQSKFSPFSTCTVISTFQRYFIKKKQNLQACKRNYNCY